MKPSQVVDVLALVGDTSDNVAGVPGIGKKGAIDLVTQFGSLDALLARAAELKPKQREALTTNREEALQSRELVTIRTDVPLEVDFESLRYRGASRERCYELFTRLAFRTLVNEYAPTADTIQKDYALVTTLERARRADRRAARGRRVRARVSFPISRSAMRATIVGIAVSHRDAAGALRADRPRERRRQRRPAGERGRAVHSSTRQLVLRTPEAAARGRRDRARSATT